MRRRERGKTLRDRLEELRPLALKTLLELMHCDDQRIRARATALWRIHGPQMVRDLERQRLRADRLAEPPKARHRERMKRPREVS